MARAGHPAFRGRRALVVVSAVSLLLSYGVVELGILVLGKTGRIPLTSSRKLRELERQATAAAPGDPSRAPRPDGTSIYTPHPYFGYLYTPKNRFTQRNPAFGNALVMTANSEGFVDDEFPRERQDDVMIYALIGGSGAMSWGIESPRERISAILQARLNEHAARTRAGKRFRVLNMGLGGFIQYQATQVFVYYAALLDGVIFYAGHNEIAHGQILQRPDPLRFPLADVLAAYHADLPSKHEIYALRRELGEVTHGCLAWKRLLTLPSRRGWCGARIGRLLKDIDDANRALTLELTKGPRATPPLADGFRQGLSSWDPAVEFAFFFSRRPADAALRRAIMDRVVPLVYTGPLVDAAAVARARNVRFVNVLQPLIAGVDKPYSRYERTVIEHPAAKKPGHDSDAVQYEVTGLEILRREAQALARLDIPTIDLNAKNEVFRRVHEDVFIDPVHLNPLGARLVAERLFTHIRERWLE